MSITARARRVATAAVAAIGLTACATLGPVAVQADTPTLVYRNSVNPAGVPQELSGVTYLGGSDFRTVSNVGNALTSLTITTNPANGAITAASVDATATLPGPIRDYEGVAFSAARNALFLSEETNTVVREFTTAPLAEAGGSPFTQPTGFGTVVANRGLESLALSANGATLYTANEEALTADGPTATPTNGTRVRIVAHSVTGATAGAGVTQLAQYRYDVAAVHGPHFANPTIPAVSGLSDLAALPDGRLLALERSLRAVNVLGFALPDFQTRIYLIDPAAGTPLTDPTKPVTDAANAAATALTKQLLWSGSIINLEGLVVGAPLGPGRYSVIGVTDNQSQGAVGNVIHAFELSIPEPGAAAALTLGAAALLRRPR